MILEFEKWQGCQNDFILVWSNHDQITTDAIKRAAPTLCHRHQGIGADGLILLKTSNSHDLEPRELVIINSDGSLASTCGNGIRCAAASTLKRIHNQQAETPELLQFLVSGQQVHCRPIGAKGEYTAVAMGTPLIDENTSFFPEAQSEINNLAGKLKLPELTADFHCGSVGNQHLVFFVEQASRDLLQKIGPALQESKHWDGINVHIASAIEVGKNIAAESKKILGSTVDELYRVFTWERGAGETKACGSGAVVTACAALQSGFGSRSSWLGIAMPGGVLYVKQPEEGGLAELCGPATFVFEGEVHL